MGTSISDSASAGSDESSAPSPRPSPRLLIMIQDLPCQFEVGCGTAGPEIMKHHRLAMAGRFREPNVPRNDRVEHLPGKVAIHLVADLERETRPTIEHREHDAFDVQDRKSTRLNSSHGYISYAVFCLKKKKKNKKRREMTCTYSSKATATD